MIRPANSPPAFSTQEHQAMTPPGSPRKRLAAARRAAPTPRVAAIPFAVPLVAAITIALSCTPMIVVPDNVELPNQLTLQLVAQGFTSPVAMAVPGDGTGRIFIVDQIGQIRILENGGLLDVPFLDVSDALVDVGIDFGGGFVFDERGLLSLAFHPSFGDNRRFFVCYNTPLADGDPEEFNSRLRISEFQVSADNPNRADRDTERIILEVVKPQFNHNGGQIAFGPDGYLYIGVGDGGMANDAGPGHNPDIGNGQDLSTLLGKILRIDIDTGDPYGVPADNPFVGVDGALGEIFAYGLRNPFRFSFDTAGDHTLFIGDVGQDRVEEVDIGQAGGNYGWRIREGSACFDPDNPGNPPEACATTDARGATLINPIIEYPHTADPGLPAGISVIGGYVYRGGAIPDLAGAYLFGDFSTSFVLANGSLFGAIQDADGNWGFKEFSVAESVNSRLGRFILSFGQDADGEVYVLTSDNVGPVGETGRVYRIAAAE
jgi:glucose/arabinose dehydrogenase